MGQYNSRVTVSSCYPLMGSYIPSSLRLSQLVIYM